MNFTERKDGVLFVLAFWFIISVVWGLFRFISVRESMSELILKPIVFIGISYFFYRLKGIPTQIFEILRSQYLHFQPIIHVFVFPFIITVVLYGLFNYQFVNFSNWNAWFLIQILSINFATAIVEETIYRGVLFVWLREHMREVQSFVFIQILFLLGHIPALFTTFDTIANMVWHIFFILLISVLSTALFIKNKSLYSAILVHGVWNSLVHYFL